jgi:hypothetical protein
MYIKTGGDSKEGSCPITLDNSETLPSPRESNASHKVAWSALTAHDICSIASIAWLEGKIKMQQTLSPPVYISIFPDSEVPETITRNRTVGGKQAHCHIDTAQCLTLDGRQLYRRDILRDYPLLRLADKRWRRTRRCSAGCSTPRGPGARWCTWPPGRTGKCRRRVEPGPVPWQSAPA